MQTSPPTETAVSDAAWVPKQFAQMQQSVRHPSVRAVSENDDSTDAWAIANRVCDRYRIPGAS
jgi:hypothetical protein